MLLQDLLTKMKKKIKYYVVWKGHKKGVYNSWEQCKIQINNFKGAKYKSFENLKDANNALTEGHKITLPNLSFSRVMNFQIIILFL